MIAYQMKCDEKQGECMNYQEFCRQNQQLWYRVANSILHDPQLAEASVLETCSRVASHMRLFEKESPMLRVWSGILAKDAAARRYQERRGPNDPLFSKTSWNYLTLDKPVPELESLEDYNAIILCMHLQALDILLLCMGGISVRAAASLLGIPEDKAERRYSEALRMLCDLLSDEDEGIFFKPESPEIKEIFKKTRRSIYNAFADNGPVHIFSEEFLEKQAALDPDFQPAADSSEPQAAEEAPAPAPTPMPAPSIMPKPKTVQPQDSDEQEPQTSEEPPAITVKPKQMRSIPLPPPVQPQTNTPEPSSPFHVAPKPSKLQEPEEAQAEESVPAITQEEEQTAEAENNDIASDIFNISEDITLPEPAAIPRPEEAQDLPSEPVNEDEALPEPVISSEPVEEPEALTLFEDVPETIPNEDAPAPLQSPDEAPGEIPDALSAPAEPADIAEPEETQPAPEEDSPFSDDETAFSGQQEQTLPNPEDAIDEFVPAEEDDELLDSVPDEQNPISSPKSKTKRERPKKKTNKPRAGRKSNFFADWWKSTMAQRPPVQRFLVILLPVIAVLLLVIFLFSFFSGKPDESPSNSQFLQVIDSFEEIALPTLNDLMYEIPELPEGFRRVSHSKTPYTANVYYMDNEGHSILFNQLAGKEPVTGFNLPQESYEPVDVKGYPGALVDQDGISRVYWYHENYCYSLLSDLGRDEALRLARASTVQSAGYPTAQHISLEALPEKYTKTLAQENGDLLIGVGETVDAERLKAFIDNCEKSKDGALRITQFVDKDTARIVDLQMQAGRLYCTIDEHRDPLSLIGIAGEEYDRLELLQANGEYSLLLHSSLYDDPIEALHF